MARVLPAFNRRVALDASPATLRKVISRMGRVVAGDPPDAAFACSSGRTAPFPMLFQQHVEKTLPVAEIRALKPVKRIHQIDQAALRGQIENAERSGNFESLIQGGRGLTVNDENQIGPEG